MKYLNIFREISEKQNGAAARYQLIEAGFSKSAIDRMLRNETIVKASNGTYVFTRDLKSWKQAASISVLQYGRGALLSHDSVLVYLGLLSDETLVRNGNVNEYQPRKIHVTVPRKRKRIGETILHKSTLLSEEESRVENFGNAHVCLETSFIYASKCFGLGELDFALEKAIRTRKIDPLLHWKRISRYKSVKGLCTRRLSLLLDNYEQDASRLYSRETESILEKRVQRALARSFKNMFVPQLLVNVRNLNYRLDFADVQNRIVIEVDGFEFHRNREAFDKDRIRQNDLASIGWRVIRITSKFSNDEIISSVERMIAQR